MKVPSLRIPGALRSWTIGTRVSWDQTIFQVKLETELCSFNPSTSFKWIGLFSVSLNNRRRTQGARLRLIARAHAAASPKRSNWSSRKSLAVITSMKSTSSLRASSSQPLQSVTLSMTCSILPKWTPIISNSMMSTSIWSQVLNRPLTSSNSSRRKRKSK